MVIWILDQSRHWKPVGLKDGLISVGVSDGRAAVVSPDEGNAVASLIPYQDLNGRRRCFLICRRGSHVRCKGLPILAGVRVLSDKDEIALGNGPEARFYYSQESKPQIVPFEEGPRPTYCARSKARITQGTPAVQCPSCGLWYIETDEMPAYTYCGEPCVGCGRPTTTDYSWAPDPLPALRPEGQRLWEKWCSPRTMKPQVSKRSSKVTPAADSR